VRRQNYKVGADVVLHLTQSALSPVGFIRALQQFAYCHEREGSDPTLQMWEKTYCLLAPAKDVAKDIRVYYYRVSGCRHPSLSLLAVLGRLP